MSFIQQFYQDCLVKFALMGLTPRTEVTLQKIAPMGDPVQIELRGYELTLRLDEARKIEIESTSKDGEAAFRTADDSSGASRCRRAWQGEKLPCP